MSSDDEHWMAVALTEARRGIGLTSPNPPVGAVIVNDGALLGAGHHRKAGGPHAEIAALQNAASRGCDVRGATAYVTLEPCSTHGRTPPCTDALIAAGIARVAYGATDPNPQHAGAADAVLREANIQVTGGVLQIACSDLIRPFAKWITTGLPYVIAKAGQSLDGRITRPPGEPQWITSEESRAHAMRLRARCDAILIGAETLRKDNPRLTLRGDFISSEKQQPWRVVVSRSGDLPDDAHLFTDEHKDRTLVLRGERSIVEILRELAAKNITTIQLEGGGNLLGQAFAARQVDEVCWYLAPMICGGGTMSVGGSEFSQGASSVKLRDVTYEAIGDDLCIHGRPDWT